MLLFILATATLCSDAVEIASWWLEHLDQVFHVVFLRGPRFLGMAVGTFAEYVNEAICEAPEQNSRINSKPAPLPA